MLHNSTTNGCLHEGIWGERDSGTIATYSRILLQSCDVYVCACTLSIVIIIMLAGGFLSGRKYSYPLTMIVYMVTNNYAHTNDAMMHCIIHTCIHAWNY